MTELEFQRLGYRGIVNKMISCNQWMLAPSDVVKILGKPLYHPTELTPTTTFINTLMMKGEKVTFNQALEHLQQEINSKMNDLMYMMTLYGKYCMKEDQTEKMEERN